MGILNARQRIAATLIAALLSLAAGFAHADYKSDYSDGIKAADKSNWPNARAKMQSAIAAEPNPQARVRIYGMRFDPYIPHYYLALAAFKLGDCAGASAALNNAAHRTVMQQAKGVDDQIAQSKLILSQCSAKIPTPANSTKPPIVPNSPSDLPISKPVATETQPDPQMAADAAKALALQAQSERERVAKLAAERLAAQQVKPIPPPAVVKAPVPAALEQIAARYFSGNLREAARSNVAGLSGKALAHALLLRAAAKYAIYQQMGGNSSERLLDLKADLLSAKNADTAAKPTARYFSREFIALYAAP